MKFYKIKIKIITSDGRIRTILVKELTQYWVEQNEC